MNEPRDERRLTRRRGRRQATHRWAPPPLRIAAAAATAALGVLIMLNEHHGRAAEAELAAAIGRLMSLPIRIIDIDQTPHYALTRGHTWSGTALHLGQTATLWAGIALVALAVALLWPRINPPRIAALGVTAIAAILTAAQLRLIANGHALATGATANSATDAIGAVVAATVTIIVVPAAIVLSRERRRRRHR